MKRLTIAFALLALCLLLSACNTEQIESLQDQVENLEQDLAAEKNKVEDLETDIIKKDVEIDNLTSDLAYYEENCVCEDLEECDFCRAVGIDALIELDDGSRYCAYCVVDVLMGAEGMFSSCGICGALASPDALFYLDADMPFCGNCVWEAISSD